MHGIPRFDATLGEALELGILIGFDGQLKQNSEMEKSILNTLLTDLYRAKLDKKEQALVWLYVKTWNAYGEHIIEYNKYFDNYSLTFWADPDWPGFWAFDDNDMEAALVSIAYSKKEEPRKDRLNS